MGDIDWFVSFASHEHLDFSGAQPSDKLGNDSLAGTEWYGVDHVAQVGFEPHGDIDRAQSSLEMGNLKATGNELLA